MILTYSFPDEPTHTVFYADTDAGGVVYYAQYLRMFEQVRALYSEDAGTSLTELAQKNCLFVCRHAEVDYLSAALLDDSLEIGIWISEHGPLSLTFAYEITCKNRTCEDGTPLLIATGKTRMVCCQKKDHRITPRRIPDWVLERFREAV